MIDTKVWGVHSTDSRLQPSQLAYDTGIGMHIILYNFRTDRCTLMEQSLTDRGDGEVIDTKVESVHLTDSRLQTSPFCH